MLTRSVIVAETSNAVVLSFTNRPLVDNFEGQEGEKNEKTKG